MDSQYPKSSSRPGLTGHGFSGIERSGCSLRPAASLCVKTQEAYKGSWSFEANCEKLSIGAQRLALQQTKQERL